MYVACSALSHCTLSKYTVIHNELYMVCHFYSTLPARNHLEMCGSLSGATPSEIVSGIFLCYRL
jgi:hypothetical protein